RRGMGWGRVAMVGGGGCGGGPQVAAGVSKAADDAAALADALQKEVDVETALKRFEAARLAQNHRIIERARHLGAYLQASRTQEEQARAGKHSTDAAVIAETAVLDFLYVLARLSRYACLTCGGLALQRALLSWITRTLGGEILHRRNVPRRTLCLTPSTRLLNWSAPVRTRGRKPQNLRSTWPPRA